MIRQTRLATWVAIAMSVTFLIGACVTSAAENNGEPYDAIVNNVFFDTYITDALQDVSLQTGVPILADSSVSGFVTLDLLDVPLPIALRQMVMPGGFSYRWMDGYYIIGTARPDSPLYHLFTVTERVKLNYLEADKLQSMMTPAYRDAVRVDVATNSALVTGTEEVVARLIGDIKKMDVPPKQVRVDALITEVNNHGRSAMGLDFAWTENDPLREGTSLKFSNLVGNLGYSFTGGLDRFLLSLRAQVDEGNAKIRANPNLVVMEGKPAELFVGRVNYYRIVTGSDSSPATRLEAIEAGVSLSINARVSDDGVITLEIAPSVSDVQGTGPGDMPVVGRRRVSTTVRVKDGETFGIAGLLQELNVETTSRVPILGSLPIIGRLFSTDRSHQEESEIIILITPQILQEDLQ